MLLGNRHSLRQRPAVGLIEQVNAHPAPVVAVDILSPAGANGRHARRGDKRRAYGHAFIAPKTVPADRQSATLPVLPHMTRWDWKAGWQAVRRLRRF